LTIVKGRRHRIHFREQPRCHWCRESITFKRHPRTKVDNDGNAIPDWDPRARWTTNHRCRKRPPMSRYNVGTGPDQAERIAERIRLREARPEA
jgi:hypothetical protein